MFTDGFSDDDGDPDATLPITQTEVRIEATGQRHSQMTMISRFGSLEAMEQILAMGAEEGMTLALGQVDELLTGTPERQKGS